MTLAVFATITPKPEHLDAARQAIVGILQDTRAEAGCLTFDLHEDPVAGKLYLYEIWSGQAALDAHYAQPYTKAVCQAYELWLAAPVESVLMQPVA